MIRLLICCIWLLFILVPPLQADFSLDGYQRYLTGGGLVNDFNVEDILERRMVKKSAPSVSANNQHKLTDDQFLEAMILEEGEVEMAAALAEIEKAKKTKIVKQVDSVTVGNSYFFSNQRQALNMGSQQQKEDDYRQSGFTSDLSWRYGKLARLDVNYRNSTINEAGYDAQQLEKTSVSLTGNSKKLGSLTGTFRQLSPDITESANEYGLDYSVYTGKMRVSLGVAREILADNQLTMEELPEYDRYLVRVDQWLTQQVFFELESSLQNYQKDQNKNREIFTGMYYYPAHFSRVSLSLTGRTSGFEKESNGTTSFSYFSPLSSSTIGLGINYQQPVSKQTKMQFGIRLEKEEYTFSQEGNEYFIATGQTGLSAGISDSLSVRLNWNVAIKQTDGYPLSQDLLSHISYRF